MEPQNFSPKPSVPTPNPISTPNPTPNPSPAPQAQNFEPVIITSRPTAPSTPPPQVPSTPPPVFTPKPIIAPPPLPTSQTPESPKKKRFPLFAIFAVLVALVVVGHFLTQFITHQTTKEITGLEVAVKTATFLDKTLQTDGSFLPGYLCDGSFAEGCVKVAGPVVHAGQAIIAYYSLAEATGDMSYRTKADRAMNYVLERCAIDVEYCEWNFFAIMHYYTGTLGTKYIEQGMLPVADKFLKASQEEAVLAQMGSKLAGLYGATQESVYKKKLLELADTELANQAANKGRDDYNMQVVWSLYIPAYNITKESKYLDAAEKFFADLNIAGNVEFDQPYSMSKAASVLLDLYDASGDEKYKAEAHVIMQKALTELWDSPDTPKFTQDYGFIDISNSTKYMLFSGGMMQQFIKLGDEKFELK